MPRTQPNLRRFFANSRAIAALALLTFRAALRSKVIAVFSCILLAIVAGLPLLIKGDGSAAGLARMTLTYTLAAAFFVMSAAALWLGCAQIAAEISAKTFQLARVKPVATWRILLGKWLGLLLINALFIAIAYSAVALRLEVRGVAREAIAPNLPPINEEIESELKRLGVEKFAPSLRRAVRRRLTMLVPWRSFPIEKESTARFEFTLPRPLDAEFVALRFQFDADAMTRYAASAECSLGDVRFTLENFTMREFELPLAADSLAGAENLTLTIHHNGGEGAGALIIQPRQGLRLMIPRAPFAVNLLRSAAIHFSILALISALALACGALFTLPVAAFTAVGVVVTALVSAFVVNDYVNIDDEDNSSIPLVVTSYVTRLTSSATQPTPLTRLAAAEYIPREEFAEALTWNCFILPLLLGAIASAALAQKELPE